jgi:enoyl-CoA hydratase/carnithine racemase
MPKNVDPPIEPSSKNAPPAHEEGPPLLISEADRAEIHLRRPAVHNRLEPDDVFRLGEMLEGLARRPELRVLVFRGRGPSFCSGINLKALGDGGTRPRAVTKALALFERLADLIEALPAPTLFVLNGPVYGGAIDMVLAGCFRIGVASTTFSVAAPSRGALYSPSGIARAANLLGASAARRLFILGQTLTAEELRAMGGIDQIGATADLSATAATLAEAICAKGPLPVRAAKRIINDAARGSFAAEAAKAMREAVSRSQDLAEGMAAWRERRPPRFKGC